MDDANLCLDTSVLIAYLKGRESGATAVEQAVQTRVCFVTAITVYELLFGVARAKKKLAKMSYWTLCRSCHLMTLPRGGRQGCIPI